MTSSIRQGEWRALATLIGTVIGAGIFGVPYVMAQAGVLVGLGYFAVIGAFALAINLYYAEIVLAVRHHHRLPGIAEHIFGRQGKWVGTLLWVVGSWLAVTIYIIIGGHFLFLFLAPIFGGTEFIYNIVFVALGALVVAGGLRWVSRAEMAFGLLMVLVLIMIILAGVPRMEAVNLFDFNSAQWFLPYGVVLFSISGFIVVPQLEDIVGNGQREKLRRVIISGMIFVIMVTALFGAVAAGVSGHGTTNDAISGLAATIGSWVVVVGAIFGFLAVITSFFTFLLDQCEIFQMDYHLPRLAGWLFGLGPPAILFLLGARDFISMLGVAGTFFSGLGGVMIAAMYLALLRKQGALGARAILPTVVGLVFLIGTVTQISGFFR